MKGTELSTGHLIATWCVLLRPRWPSGGMASSPDEPEAWWRGSYPIRVCGRYGTGQSLTYIPCPFSVFLRSCLTVSLCLCLLHLRILVSVSLFVHFLLPLHTSSLHIANVIADARMHFAAAYRSFRHSRQSA